MRELQNWEEPVVTAWLLSLANDMRLAKGDKTLDDLPESTPRNSDRCIIANAFNYGCSVEPTYSTISFQCKSDRNTYLEVMGMNWTESVNGDNEPCTVVDNYGEYFYNDAPMTQELVDIAEAFDEGQMFDSYVTFRD